MPTRAKILIVDDASENLQILNAILREDYKLAAALSGERALFLVRQGFLPDLILLDIMMPQLDGYEVCRRLKEDPQTQDIPVIFISALQEAEDKVKAFASGGVDYVTKPFHPEEILARVKTHLHLRALQQSLSQANQRLHNLLEQQQAILQSAGEGMLGVGRDGRLVFVNPRALEQLGYTQEELLEIDFHTLVYYPPPADLSEPESCPIRHVLRTGGSRFVAEDRFFRKDGTAFPVEYTVSRSDGEGERPIAILVFRDITRRRLLEQQLKEAAVVFDISGEGILLTDAQGQIRRVNPAFSEITGYAAEEVIGQILNLFKPDHHQPEFYAEMQSRLAAEGHWEGEIWNRRKDGSIYPEWQMITAIRGDDGRLLGYVSQFSDITRRKLAEEEIRYRGNHDALTGLANRSLLLERLEMAIKEHRRKERKLGLLFIDLDHFKQVNDSLGHPIGDLLLQQVARRIRQQIREIDTAARFGGDEFVVMLVDLKDQTACERIAPQICKVLDQPFELEGKEVRIGASIGIVLFPDDGENIQMLLRNADLATYRAKKGGRHRVEFFTEAMELEFIEHNRLEVDLQRALKREVLELVYLPILDLRTGRAVGAESLIRWHHKTLGPIAPDTFIPLAEESGLIHAVGTWVLESVCRRLGQWQTQGRLAYLSVNLSARQIPHGLSPEWLANLAECHDLPAGRLVLEITEDAFAKEAEAVATWMKRLRDLGFRLHLDDFGTGYSSLSHLRHFPVDAVKIDPVFVRGAVQRSQDRALVRAIVAMSEEFGFQVIAEGLETPEQQALLRELNCFYGQGYLFSLPLSGAQLEDYRF